MADPKLVVPVPPGLLARLSNEQIGDLLKEHFERAPGASRALLDASSARMGQDPDFVILEGRWHYAQSNFREAEAAFSRAVELGDRSGAALFARAKCRRILGDRALSDRDKRQACEQGYRPACE